MYLSFLVFNYFMFNYLVLQIPTKREIQILKYKEQILSGKEKAQTMEEYKTLLKLFNY